MKRLQYNSPVILSFFFLSLLALLLGHMTGGWTTAGLFSVYRSSLADPLTYIRFLGHVLGHADLSHFLGIVFMLIMLASLSGMKGGKIPLTLLLVGVLYLGQEVYSMLFVEDQVANLMHIVGGICGTAFGFWLGRQRESK